MHPSRHLTSLLGALPSGLLLREEGQDLLEYSLLLAFIALSGAALFLSIGDLTGTLWSISNDRLASANSAS